MKTVEILKVKRYTVVKICNKYLDDKSDYNGIHLDVVSNTGQKFELQLHSDESLAVKNKIHPMYEESRNVNTSTERKEELEEMMREISALLPRPIGIGKIQNYEGAKK